jgi:hypothetical protein
MESPNSIKTSWVEKDGTFQFGNNLASTCMGLTPLEVPVAQPRLTTVLLHENGKDMTILLDLHPIEANLC